MKILLVCHTSREIGMGHFIRQLQVADEMISRGIEVSFAVSDYEPALSLLNNKNFSYFTSNEMPPVLNPDSKTDVILFDINDTGKDYIKSLKKNRLKIVSFEDLGPGRDYVDLLIDSNLKSGDSSKTTSLFGPEYVILNGRFSEFRDREKGIPNKIKNVVISMGGTDPKSIGPVIADFLLKSDINIKIELISGAGFNDKNNTAKKINFSKNSNSRFKICKNLPDLAEIFFNADIVICAGGITLYEACVVGTPALVTSQVGHQQKKADKVENWGAAVNLGMWETPVLKKLLPAIESLDIVKRRKMSIAGKKMVDGKGLQRVVDEIVTFF